MDGWAFPVLLKTGACSFLRSFEVIRFTNVINVGSHGKYDPSKALTNYHVSYANAIKAV